MRTSNFLHWKLDLFICRNPGSNQGPLDLQSNALPTELFRHEKPLLWRLFWWKTKVYFRDISGENLYRFSVIQIMVSSEDVQVYIDKLTWLCFTSLPKEFSFLTDYGPVAVLRVFMFTRQVVVPTGSSKSRCERLLITVKSYIHVSIIRG